jgi:HAE1 family hydrophobic/amphiphilic exporter-1
MVASLAIPLSLLIALTVMFFAGETLNIISLLALMVCVGLLVDNSVVVAENIDRLNKSGVPRREAAIRGASEIALAITMSTLTTVIVFLPVSLVEGQAQFFLLRMSIPISVALGASLLVALIYVPLGVYLTLPSDRGGDRARRARGGPYGRALEFSRWLYEQSFSRLNRVYGWLLARALMRRLDLVFALVVIFAVTAAIAKQELRIVDVQDEERRGFEIDVRMPDHYTLEETEEWFLEAESIVERHAGELGLEGWFLFHLKTRGELQGWFTSPRSTNLSPQEVTERVVELLPRRAGMELITGQESQLEEDDGQSTWRCTLNGENPEQLEVVASELEQIFTRVDGVLGLRRDDIMQPNELALVVDRDRTQRYGIDPRAVAGVVGYALRGQALPKYRDEGREIPVRVRFQESDRQDLIELASFMVPTESGEFLPLSSVTDVAMLDQPEAIVRRDKRIARTVTLDLRPDQEERTRKQLNLLRAGIDLPEGVRFSADELRRGGLDDDQRNLLFALMLSIVFIYLLMGLLFESFILPLSIIFTIPLASFGVLWIHILSGLDLDFLGMVGIVLLVGVVVNNGIVLIDTVNRLREGGMRRNDAILLATERRFRPIMMTAITTVGGMVPLALSGRMDSGISYTSFSFTLIGGMSTATLLTLLVVPVFYTFFDDLRRAFTGAVRRGTESSARRGAVHALRRVRLMVPGRG